MIDKTEIILKGYQYSQKLKELEARLAEYGEEVVNLVLEIRKTRNMKETAERVLEDIAKHEAMEETHDLEHDLETETELS